MDLHRGTKEELYGTQDVDTEEDGCWEDKEWHDYYDILTPDEEEVLEAAEVEKMREILERLRIWDGHGPHGI